MGQLTRLSDGAGSTPVVQDRWQEMFWTETGHSRNAAAARSASVLFEQAELWPSRSGAAKAAVVPPQAVARPDVAPVAKRSVAHARSRPVARRTVAAGSLYADRGHCVRRADIARYLQVNNAVYGRVAPVEDLSLPRRSFNAVLNLWKGSEIGTPFVTGC